MCCDCNYQFWRIIFKFLPTQLQQSILRVGDGFWEEVYYLFFPLVYQSDFLSLFLIFYMKVSLPYPGIHLMRCFGLQATGRAFNFSCLPCLFFSYFLQVFTWRCLCPTRVYTSCVALGLRQLVVHSLGQSLGVQKSACSPAFFSTFCYQFLFSINWFLWLHIS